MDKSSLLLLAISLVVVLAFQGCGVGTNPHFSSDISEPMMMSSGNGDGYGGKVTRYERREQDQPCTQTGKDGKALPNDEIISYSMGATQLVRRECADIAPLTLTPQEIIPTAPGVLTYNGKVFTEQLDVSSFNVIAATCPAGRNALPSPARINLMENPDNLMGTEWSRQPSITTRIVGSLASLPLIEIARNNSTAEGWERFAQTPTVNGGELYVYSFFVMPSAETIRFISYSDTTVHDLEVTFDGMTGSATLLNDTGVSNVSTSVRNFAGGLFLSVYFMPNIAMNANLGFAPQSTALGAAVRTGAIQLEQVSSFCGP